MTAVTVRTRNVEKSQPDGADMKHGGGVSAVELRTPAIFSSKKRCSFCASMDVDSGMRPRPMRASTDCNRRRGIEHSDSTFAWQNDSHAFGGGRGTHDAQWSKIGCWIRGDGSAGATGRALKSANRSLGFPTLVVEPRIRTTASTCPSPLRYQPVEDDADLRVVQTCQMKRYSNSFNCIMLVETTHLTQVEYYISLADVRAYTFVSS